eukprot:7054605-Alexandrium_andersonii.AAC.1
MDQTCVEKPRSRRLALARSVALVAAAAARAGTGAAVAELREPGLLRQPAARLPDLREHPGGALLPPQPD